jgi:two-component system response regulator (stage 0 sporulation protein F)
MDDGEVEMPTHRVLLAEDDDEMRALISLRLRADGYELVEVPNGLALLEAVGDAQARLTPIPSVIVSDLRMPGMSGVAVLRAVRQHGWSTAFVLITAFGDEDALNEAAHLGASIVLHKPFELDDLRRVIRCVLPSPVASD